MERRNLLQALATLSITTPNLIDHTVLTIEDIFPEFTVYKTRRNGKPTVVAYRQNPDKQQQYHYYHYYDSSYPNRVEVTDTSENRDIDWFGMRTNDHRKAHQILQDAEELGLDKIRSLYP
mgnify:FL=1